MRLLWIFLRCSITLCKVLKGSRLLILLVLHLMSPVKIFFICTDFRGDNQWHHCIAQQSLNYVLLWLGGSTEHNRFLYCIRRLWWETIGKYSRVSDNHFGHCVLLHTSHNSAKIWQKGCGKSKKLACYSRIAQTAPLSGTRRYLSWSFFLNLNTSEAMKSFYYKSGSKFP